MSVDAFVVTSAVAPPGARYEFRVWDAGDDVRTALEGMAGEPELQLLDDWYLVVDRADCNVKVRAGHLKVKRLLAERHGFQCWSRSCHALDGGQVDPMAILAAELDWGDGAGPTGDPARSIPVDFEVIRVRKRRRRFEIGRCRAEVTDVQVTDATGRLATVAIEGRHLRDLLRLRRALGLDLLANRGVHLAVGEL